MKFKMRNEPKHRAVQLLIKCANMTTSYTYIIHSFWGPNKYTNQSHELHTNTRSVAKRILIQQSHKLRDCKNFQTNFFLHHTIVKDSKILSHVPHSIMLLPYIKMSLFHSWERIFTKKNSAEIPYFLGCLQSDSKNWITLC